MQTDQVDVRIKSVNLIGKLLTVVEDYEIHEHHFLFVELLKRFSDKSAEVRISVIRAVKACYMANPSAIESHEILCKFVGLNSCNHKIQSILFSSFTLYLTAYFFMMVYLLC